MTLACIIKLETIVIDDPRSDTPNCSITYDRHHDDHNSFIIQATGDRMGISLIGHYHQLDGVTNPKYKLLLFLTTNSLQTEEGTSF
jgi:hypothetical protein